MKCTSHLDYCTDTPCFCPRDTLSPEPQPDFTLCLTLEILAPPEPQADALRDKLVGALSRSHHLDDATARYYLAEAAWCLKAAMQLCGEQEMGNGSDRCKKPICVHDTKRPCSCAVGWGLGDHMTDLGLTAGAAALCVHGSTRMEACIQAAMRCGVGCRGPGAGDGEGKS